jgi:hypothetical protein
MRFNDCLIMPSNVGGGVVGEGEVRQVNRSSAQAFEPPKASGLSAPAKALGGSCVRVCLQRAATVT